MPIRRIPETEIRYALLNFDALSVERQDPDGIEGRMSSRVLEQARESGCTDVFFFTHGWKGDGPAAIGQYDRWIKALADASEKNAAQTARVFPGFRPLYVGLHWPSLPWGDEDIQSTGDSFSAGSGPEDLEQQYLERLGDTPEIRSALAVILESARKNAAADELPDEVRQAYLDLNSALALGDGGVAAAPDSDREPFDPDAAFLAGNDQGSDFAGFSLGGLLGPLRQLSFWTMKKRARTVGEGGMHLFLNALQHATQARIHLMGHSFGCIVVSGILGGPDRKSPLQRPVDSVAFIQGALSLWSYSPRIPSTGGPGYFSHVLPDKTVRGPLIATHSVKDTAVRVFYPLAAQVAQQVAYKPGELPKYGGMGMFGIQGLDGDLVHAVDMKPVGGAYDFQPGRVYNLESSAFIAKMDGASGAHSDIAGPEVAQAVWQAALASVSPSL